MQLMTPSLEKEFKRIWNQQRSEDPLVVAKYFHPFSQRTRYATEYDPKTETFFGFVAGDYGERWYFNKKEMEKLLFAWLHMERDKYWEPVLFSTIKDILY